jgi:hypothetical protein
MKRRGTVARIAVVTIGLLSPVAALLAQPSSSTAGKNWNSPIRVVVASGPTSTASPNGKNWN